MSSLLDSPAFGPQPVDASDQERQRCMDMSTERGDFVLDMDGCWYYWPSRVVGSMASRHLRWLADEVDRLNALEEARDPWEPE